MWVDSCGLVLQVALRYVGWLLWSCITGSPEIGGLTPVVLYYCDILGLSYIIGSNGLSYITGRKGLS